MKSLEDRREYQREYHARNRAKRNQASREYYAARKEQKRAYDTQRRFDKGDELRAQRRIRWELERSTAATMLSRARARAKKHGVPFNITVSDISIPEFCPVLGIPLKCVAGRGGGDSSPSLDRIIPSLGYVAGNVVVISSRANRLKNDGSLAELLAVCKWLSELNAAR